MTKLALEMHGVTKSFTTVRALQGIDLTVPSGVIFGLVGPNGAGKTTLFSVLCGFLKADDGKIQMGGTEITPGTPPPPGKFAILPQDARFAPSIPVQTQLEYYARLSGFNKEVAKKEAQRVLQLVGLPEVAKRAPDTLSHGMHKRIGIAQAFLGKPDLVILDEPTAGLDPKAAGDIRALLGTIRGEQTVMVSSHNLLEIEDLCTEVAILHKGKIVRQDSIAALVGGAAEVSFRMANPPAHSLHDALKSLPYVKESSWDATQTRLRIVFDKQLKPADQASSELVAFLVGKGVTFLEMQLGKSLEDRFLEETR